MEFCSPSGRADNTGGNFSAVQAALSGQTTGSDHIPFQLDQHIFFHGCSSL